MKNFEAASPSFRESLAARRKTIKPKTVHASQEELVRVGALPGGGALPLVVQPSFREVNLTEWAANNRAFIEESLREHGGILFRGFDTRDHVGFDSFLQSIALPKMHYMEGATPRTELRDKVYTSTEYPAEQHIALHNELNYVITWPRKIFFFCVTPAASGGQTPIANVHNLYQRLSPETAARFEEKGWMLVRNFGDGLSLPWQTTFRLQTRDELEDYCRAARISCEWKDENRVRTRQVRPAVRRHPATGQKLWFNHVAFWHVSSLDPLVREMFLAEFDQEDLPYNTYYGDGSPIEDSVVEEIRRAYREETVAFLWQRGDLLMLDNMLVAHGRYPYAGERKILTSMGEPFSDQESWSWSRRDSRLVLHPA